MSGSDDEELAELRRARAARLGAAGLTVVSLPCLLGRATFMQRLGARAESASWPPCPLQSSLRSQLAPSGRQQQREQDDEDEDGPTVLAEEEVQEELRAMLPTGFGEWAAWGAPLACIEGLLGRACPWRSCC